MQLEEALTTTRAVRKRLDLDRPVPRELIGECIDLAIQAPTGSNAQGWRWLVVTDPDAKKVIATVYRKAWDVYKTLPSRGTAADEAQQARVVSSASYLADNLDRVPVHVIPCVQGALPDGAPGWMWAGILGSVYPAVWSFQLAARARGLGSVFTTLHLMHAGEVAEALGIPDTVMQCALIPVGFYRGEGFKPAKRVPAGELTHWERWPSP